MLVGKSLCHCFLRALSTFVSFIPSLKVVHYEAFEAFNLIRLSYFFPPREASCSACKVCASPQEIQHVMHPKLTQLPGRGRVGGDASQLLEVHFIFNNKITELPRIELNCTILYCLCQLTQRRLEVIYLKSTL